MITHLAVATTRMILKRPMSCDLADVDRNQYPHILVFLQSLVAANTPEVSFPPHQIDGLAILLM
jgi:hypothetical protein